MAKLAVGIDLGTTFSAIAYVNRHKRPEIIPNAEGDRITPSIILFDKDEVIVGNYARQSAVACPDRVVEFVKRHMGDESFFFEYRGQAYSPERLSSFILSKLKHDAELRLGEPVEYAVITVPAYFGDRQRRATMMAGEQAGLKVLKLLNEPTAAAFAYGLDHSGEPQKVLVFDLGGGTFDVTVVQIEGRDIQVVATSGDHQLGGKDWDDALISWVAEHFREKHGIDPLDDLAAYHDLRQKCVSAKLSLSRRPKVNIFFDHAGKMLRVPVTREQFEELTAPLLRRCEALTRDVLEEAGLGIDGVDKVLLAGGSTRMPMVRRMLTELFGREPSSEVNPDECVAIGAALTAALESARLAGEAPPVDLRTHDVSSHSLGLATLKDGRLHNSRIIRRNSRIPCERTRDHFVTTHDEQTTLDLWLLQGENPDPLECTVLGHFEFYGIPPRPRGQSRIGITYRYNANGIVEVEAMDLSTGQTLAHRISSGRVRLEDVAAGRVPVHIAILVDASGSLYGPAGQALRESVRTFARLNLPRSGRKASLLAFPGGLLVSDVDRPEPIEEALSKLVFMGASPLAQGLRAARRLLRARAGVMRVVVLFTDGQLDELEGAVAEAQRLRTTGGHILVVGVGRRRDEVLRALATRPEDIYPAEEPPDIGEVPPNLLTELPLEEGKEP